MSAERTLQDSFYLRQNELTQKSITLQVTNDHLKVNKQLCEERKLLLRKEIKALVRMCNRIQNQHLFPL